MPRTTTSEPRGNLKASQEDGAEPLGDEASQGEESGTSVKISSPSDQEKRPRCECRGSSADSAVTGPQLPGSRTETSLQSPGEEAVGSVQVQSSPRSQLGSFQPPPPNSAQSSFLSLLGSSLLQEVTQLQSPACENHTKGSCPPSPPATSAP